MNDVSYDLKEKNKIFFSYIMTLFDLFWSTCNSVTELFDGDASFHFIVKNVIWFFVCLKFKKQFCEKLHTGTPLEHDSTLKSTSYIDPWNYK